MGWVDLSTLYVQKSGDTMEGSLVIPQNQTLTCYNDTTAYNVGATLKSLQDSVSSLNKNLGNIIIRSGSWVGKLGNNTYWDWMSYSELFSLFGLSSPHIANFTFIINNGEAGATPSAFQAQFDNSRNYVRIMNPSGATLPTVTIRLNWTCIYNPNPSAF